MIEVVTSEDLDEVIKIMQLIKEEMRKEGNPQWGSTKEDYPSFERILEDINNKQMIKFEENQIIKGIMTIVEDTSREYDELINNSKEKSYILHRLAIPKEYRNQNIATKLIKYAENKAKKNNIKILKSDTEISNVKMNNLFIKEGFIYKENFSYEDYPGTYKYYEKEVE